MPTAADRQVDILKIIVTIVFSLSTLAGGAWMTVLNTKMNDLDRKVSETMTSDAERKAKVEAVFSRLDEVKIDMTKRLDQIESKIDALYIPYGTGQLPRRR